MTYAELPSWMAMRICLEIFANKAALAPSFRAFVCFMLAHFEWPAMQRTGCVWKMHFPKFVEKVRVHKFRNISSVLI